MQIDPKPSPPPLDHQEPSQNQFGLRGMFLLMTALCLIFAAISWAGIRQPIHLVGALAIVVFCLIVIGVIEAVRNLTYGSAITPFRPLDEPFGDTASKLFPKALPTENPFRDEALPDPTDQTGPTDPPKPTDI
jgi:hypothetical protein